MHLDGTQGRQLLRVLLQTAMINHSSLASQALKLIIRHFSQRDEMVKGFKQVHTCLYVHVCTYVCMYVCMYVYNCMHLYNEQLAFGSHDCSQSVLLCCDVSYVLFIRFSCWYRMRRYRTIG